MPHKILSQIPEVTPETSVLRWSEASIKSSVMTGYMGELADKRIIKAIDKLGNLGLKIGGAVIPITSLHI